MHARPATDSGATGERISRRSAPCETATTVADCASGSRSTTAVGHSLMARAASQMANATLSSASALAA